MPPASTLPPNWLDASDYDGLKVLDRSGFAWELLRRNPAYAEAVDGLGADRATRSTLLTPAPQAETVAASWGLSFPRGAGRHGPIRADLLAV